MSSSPLADFGSARFTELLNTRFQVETGAAGAVEVQLIQVSPPRKLSEGGEGTSEYESFSIVFQGPEQSPLSQGTHSFQHPQMGTFALFIVPILRKAGAIQYQAVFNRLVNRA